MSALFRLPRSVLYQIRNSAILRYSQKGSIEDNTSNVEIPTYEPRAAETIETKKSRLLYQSRKRGMLENDLILSTFAAKYLTEMNENQTQLYDHLINLPSNDWDLYNWATGKKPTPPEFDNEVMNMLKEHVENKNREVRLKQPSLY